MRLKNGPTYMRVLRGSGVGGAEEVLEVTVDATQTVPEEVGNAGLKPRCLSSLTLTSS